MTCQKKLDVSSQEVKFLKEFQKNLKENYIQKFNLKRKDQLKTKDDVSITEAFELYMLKKFLQK